MSYGKIESKNLVLFEQKEIRRIFRNNKWYFSIIDVVEVLTESDRPRKYWNDLKKKLIIEGFDEVSEKIGQLKLIAKDGKLRETDIADTETLLRIIQTIPSQKAEPFKRWLATIGYERIQEIENPELAMERMKELYQKKGYSKEWIDKRQRGISVRNGLTDEWQNRGAKKGLEYAILTDEIVKATFGVTTVQYKNIKGLNNKNNLRDNMTDIELILTMLGEATATTIHKERETLRI